MSTPPEQMTCPGTLIFCISSSVEFFLAHVHHFSQGAKQSFQVSPGHVEKYAGHCFTLPREVLVLTVLICSSIIFSVFETILGRASCLAPEAPREPGCEFLPDHVLQLLEQRAPGTVEVEEVESLT